MTIFPKSFFPRAPPLLTIFIFKTIGYPDHQHCLGFGMDFAFHSNESKVFLSKKRNGQ